MSRWYGPSKRVIDVAVAVPAFVASLPVQALIAVAIAMTSGRPVLFRQARPGLHGRLFELVKFRTMLPIDAEQGLADDRSRLTMFGTVLRATSLDELPTLWNVIRGDMSLVGPRPLLVEYLDRYDEQQARRHEVRPGLTGLAQVAGRNAVCWEDRLRLDVEYVDRRSLLLDLAIVVSTIGVILRRDGISAPGDVTMPVFLGTHGRPVGP